MTLMAKGGCLHLHFGNRGLDHGATVVILRLHLHPKGGSRSSETRIALPISQSIHPRSNGDSLLVLQGWRVLCIMYVTSMAGGARMKVYTGNHGLHFRMKIILFIFAFYTILMDESRLSESPIRIVLHPRLNGDSLLQEWKRVSLGR
jgi:hypothetical protein